MRKTVLVTAAGLVLLAGCSGTGKNAASSGAARTEQRNGAVAGVKDGAGTAAGRPAGAGGGPAAIGAAVPLSRSIVRTANISVRVTDADAAGRSAVSVAERAGGYLQSEHSSIEAGTTLTLRVPPEAFADTLDALARLGKVDSREVSTEDVTGDVADVSGRLAAARASVARLRGLMARAASVTEIASLESELNDRESDLESLQSRQRALSGRTSLATVTATLHQTAARPPAPKVAATGFTGGFRNGWRAFVGFLNVTLVVVGALLPFAVAAALVAAALVPVYRRRRRVTQAAHL